VAGSLGQRWDAWSEWLIHGRDAHLEGDELRAQHDQLRQFRDRVLRGARIQEGDLVVDIGAGTGLVSLGAAALAGHQGRVLAVDISSSALAQCRSETGTSGLAAVRYAVADATRLPLPNSTVNVALARSVLIYIPDKQAAITEMYRVLRPGGRVSIFEPINSAADRLELPIEVGFQPGGPVPEALRAQHEQVDAVYRAQSRHWNPMMDFDERDLIRAFVEAGFDTVGVAYEILVTRLPGTAAQARQFLDERGNPTAPTWREAAVQALGHHASTYLQAYVSSQEGRVRTDVHAFAVLTASRGAG